MTFIESIAWKQKYIETFGTECDPIKYAPEDDPEVVFIGLVAQCCLEFGKPYEEMKIADINSYIMRLGLDSVALEHWRPQDRNEQSPTMPGKTHSHSQDR